MTENTKLVMRRELEDAEKSFYKLISSLSEKDLKKKSKNAGWTNGGILFHILFAYIIVSALIPLLRFFGRFPKSFSKNFANILNFGTSLFNWINALGARGGASVFNKKRLRNKASSIFDSLLKKIDSIEESDWKAGMYYPTKWDSLFDEYMTLEKLFHYPTKHFKFHLKQIRVPKLITY